MGVNLDCTCTSTPGEGIDTCLFSVIITMPSRSRFSSVCCVAIHTAWDLRFSCFRNHCAESGLAFPSQSRPSTEYRLGPSRHGIRDGRECVRSLRCHRKPLGGP